MQGSIIVQLQQTMQEYVSDTVPISTFLSLHLLGWVVNLQTSKREELLWRAL